VSKFSVIVMLPTLGSSVLLYIICSYMTDVSAILSVNVTSSSLLAVQSIAGKPHF